MDWQKKSIGGCLLTEDDTNDDWDNYARSRNATPSSIKPQTVIIVTTKLNKRIGHTFLHKAVHEFAHVVRQSMEEIYPVPTGKNIQNCYVQLLNSYEEIGAPFDLERALQVGTLPGIYLDRETGADVLGTYATVYLREEIQAEALTREIGSYSRFLDAAAEASGHWVNYSKLSNDTEIPRETLRRFYSILEDTLIAFRLPPFKPKKSKRRVSQRDRFIFFDVGVRNAILGIHRHPVSPTERSHIFEQWFILQCMYHARAHGKPWQFWSYRTDDGAEVDLVIQTDGALIAIECKSRAQSSGIDLRGLNSFAGVAHLPVLRYVVYTGDTRQKLNDETILVPYQDFLLKELQEF